MKCQNFLLIVKCSRLFNSGFFITVFWQEHSMSNAGELKNLRDHPPVPSSSFLADTKKAKDVFQCQAIGI